MFRKPPCILQFFLLPLKIRIFLKECFQIFTKQILGDQKIDIAFDRIF